MSSLRARIIRSLTSRIIRRIDMRHAPVEKMRKSMDTVGRLVRRARHVAVETTEVCGLHAEWYRPPGAAEGKVLLYLHGGAYVMGSCKSHRGMVTHIARDSGVNALLPEYRLAPEHPFSAGLDDCVAVYRSLLADGYQPHDIMVAGDSAGGGLTVALMLVLRHAGDPLPVGGVLLSPFLDFTVSGESVKTRAAQEPWFDAADIDVMIGYYCKGEDLENPLLSPVYANVAGLPPMLIQVGDDEILLSDSTRFADKMTAAGCSAEIEVFPEMWHVFQLFVGKMPESKAAIHKIAAFIKERLSIIS